MYARVRNVSPFACVANDDGETPLAFPPPLIAFRISAVAVGYGGCGGLLFAASGGGRVVADLKHLHPGRCRGDVESFLPVAAHEAAFHVGAHGVEDVLL